MIKSCLKLLSVLLFIVYLVNVIPGREEYQAAAQSAIDPRFGAIESFWAPSEAAALGVGWERILFYWSEIQPTGPGDWNTLHVLEEWLTEANAQGRTIVGLLKNTPGWATDGEPFSGVPRGLYLPVDDPNNLWATYVRQVASYYGARGVHHWIVWNEPDIAPDVYGHEFGGSTQDYYQLVKVAYQVMKQVDPSVTIHLGGMTYWHDPGYLRRFLQVVVADPEAATNNYFFDVITLHIYFRPETVTTIVGNAFAAQNEVGISPLKAVWVNETNARPSMDPEWPVEVQSFPVDLEQQAWYIVQAYALGFNAGAARIGVYKLVDINMAPGDESWGLIRPYDFSKRPAYFAYETTIKYLSGFTYPVRREQYANYYLVRFNRPQGVTRVLWARNQTAVTAQVPALAETAVLVTALGEASQVVAENGVYSIHLEGARCHGECYMGGPPLFLVEGEGSTASLPTAAPVTAAATTAAVTTSPTTVAAAPGTETPLPDTTSAATAVSTGDSTPTETALPTATATDPPTATRTPLPTPTLLPTATATAIPSLTATPSPAATEVALVVKTAVPTAAATAAVATAVPTDDDWVASGQISWWFLGIGGGLALFLLLAWLRQR